MLDPNQLNSQSLNQDDAFQNHTSSQESELETYKLQIIQREQLSDRNGTIQPPLSPYPPKLAVTDQKVEDQKGHFDQEVPEKTLMVRALQTKLEQLEEEKKALVLEKDSLKSRINKENQNYSSPPAFSKGGILNPRNLTATTTRRLFSGLKRRFTPISAHIDSPLANTLTKSTFLVVEGWAYSAAGSIIDIQVFLDEELIGRATRGNARADVAGFFSAPGMINSGFTGKFALKSPAFYGSKNLRILALDSAGNSQELINPVILEKPAVALTLDEPVTGMVTAGVVTVSGWAFSGETSISTIQILRGDQLIGTVPYGISRPDVVTKTGYSNVERSGFWGIINLPPGVARKEILTVRAIDALGNLSDISVEINLISLDEPAAEIERVKWQTGLFQLEGYALWPVSQSPRRVRLFVNGKFIEQVSLNLVRQDIQNRFPNNPLALRSGFKFGLPLKPSKEEACQDLHEIMIEFVDGEGRYFQRTCHVEYEPRTSQVPNLELWRQFLAEYEDRFGYAPAILDWTLGQNLTTAFPGQNIFPAFPSATDSLTLPYMDQSIDLVIVREGDIERLAEARRVASTGTLIIMSPEKEKPYYLTGLPAEVVEINRPDSKDNFKDFKVQWRTEELSTSTRLPSASIIIPTYKRADLVNDCLEQLLITLPSWLKVEIIVVDDASCDTTGQVLENWTNRDSRVRGLPNPQNVGFLRSCNLGAAAAKGDILIFLNNDTLPQPGWLSPLLRTMADYPEAGAVGGKLIYPNGVLQEAGGIIFEDAEGWNFGRGSFELDAPIYNYFREVDYCSGALLATRRTLFEEVGGFDTHFAPMYYEDVDYCFTLRQKGYKVYYQPESKVIHLEGGTAGTDTFRGFKVWQVINRDKFIEKWEESLKRQPLHPKELDYKISLDLAVRDGENNPV